jgi:hypothetical protein
VNFISKMTQNREELLKHLAASLKDAKEEGGAILLVGAGISVSAGIPPAQQLMKIAIENFPNYFTEQEQHLAQDDLSQLQYNNIMTKLSNVKRKELFKWFIEGNKEKGIKKAKLNFAHIAIAELLKQGYFSRILTVNFDPLLIHACYMVGMYPFPAIYDLGAMGQVNAELLHNPSIVYLNGQHVGFVQRNTTDQLEAHKETLTQIVRSTGCSKTWVVAGYSGENDPLMDALNGLKPFNNWLYWLEYGNQVLQKETHRFLEKDEECKVIYGCDADDTFISIISSLECKLEFIENPQTEFENFFKNINFDTAGGNSSRYINLINKMIEILSNPEIQNNINQVVSIEDYENAVESSLTQFLLIENHSIQSLASSGIIEKLDEAYEYTNNDDYFIKKAIVYMSLFNSSNKENSNYLIFAQKEFDNISEHKEKNYFYKINLCRLKALQNQLDEVKELLTTFSKDDMSKAWGIISYSSAFLRFREQNQDIVNMILKPKNHSEPFATLS